VHGLDERDAPPLLGDSADLAGQPVVAVHEIVPAGRVRSLGPQQLEGELTELAGKIRFVEIFERPGGQMTDEDAGRELGDLRLVAGYRPGEYVNLDTPLGEALGDLNDVDIKTACVAGPWLLERRCVNADGRDAPWVASRHGPHLRKRATLEPASMFPAERTGFAVIHRHGLTTFPPWFIGFCPS
jgi:hypothetical protein